MSDTLSNYEDRHGEKIKEKPRSHLNPKKDPDSGRKIALTSLSRNFLRPFHTKRKRKFPLMFVIYSYLFYFLFCFRCHFLLALKLPLYVYLSKILQAYLLLIILGRVDSAQVPRDERETPGEVQQSHQEQDLVRNVRNVGNLLSHLQKPPRKGRHHGKSKYILKCVLQIAYNIRSNIPW